MDIEIDIQIDGEALDDALLDPYEVEMLLDTTRAQIREHIQRSLAGQVCDEHGQTPRVLVTGTYSSETEQIDYTYSIEACCNLMTMKTAALLSRI